MDGVSQKYYLSGQKAAELLGVGQSTLRGWATAGTIQAIRTPGGQRRYDCTHLLPASTEREERKMYCYCRVSSASQKDDLARQIQYMQERFPGHQIVSDVGSGINIKRKGLQSLLGQAMQGLVGEVVVAYRDRLARFAFELLQWIFQQHGVRLVVLDPNVGSAEEELSADLLAIVQVFCCRANGRRKYKKSGHDHQEGAALPQRS